MCTLAEAKTIYPMMGIAANIALVVAGNYMKWVNGPLAGGSMILSLRYLVGTVVALSVVMFGAKAYVDARVVTAEDAPDPKAPPKKKKKKGGSIAECVLGPPSFGDCLGSLRGVVLSANTFWA